MKNNFEKRNRVKPIGSMKINCSRNSHGQRAQSNAGLHCPMASTEVPLLLARNGTRTQRAQQVDGSFRDWGGAS